VDASTGDVVQTRYKPWGEVRFTTANATLPTRYTFTGQYSYVSDDATDLGNAGFGLMFYNARWYDPAIGRFVSADTVVPGGVQGLDRYAYVSNSPVVYTDPTGHYPDRTAYWSISLTINLSNSIPVNAIGAQFRPNSNSGLSGQYNNLCGDIVLEMIYDTFVSDAPLSYFQNDSRPPTALGDVPTWAWELGLEFANSFPSGWTGIAYQFGSKYGLEGGNSSFTSYTDEAIQFDHLSNTEILSIMIRTLSQGHFLIMLATIDASGKLVKSTTYHWVVITGVSQDGVTIKNPFTNRSEVYSWEEYFASFGYGAIEIIPPSNVTVQVTIRTSPLATPE